MVVVVVVVDVELGGPLGRSPGCDTRSVDGGITPGPTGWLLLWLRLLAHNLHRFYVIGHSSFERFGMR